MDIGFYYYCYLLCVCFWNDFLFIKNLNPKNVLEIMQKKKKLKRNCYKFITMIIF